MERQPITTRDTYDFDYDEKIEISEKSAGRCAHCGKLIFFGGEATVDHFVPLDKGGLNRKVNTVMLCRKCNKEKNNKVVNPKNYLLYMKPEAYDELDDYFTSYIKSFDYVTRRNLLCCDLYTICMDYGDAYNHYRKRPVNRKASQKLCVYYTMERATQRDGDEMLSYFVEYLKKYNMLGSEDAAMKNIIFWLKFGTIYIIRDTHRTIQILLPITMTDMDSEHHALTMYLFAKYSNSKTMALAEYAYKYITTEILYENNLPYVRLILKTCFRDPVGQSVATSCVPTDGSLTESFYIMNPNNNHPDDYNESEIPFYRRFDDVAKEAEHYLSAKKNSYIRYMMKDLVRDDYGNNNNT